ncbi:MAG TPA: VanZ family protein [Burkholderiales bacterium]|jgi:VanZ family protein|nr:VanZ family protein [Burkholderiales bacterium]
MPIDRFICLAAGGGIMAVLLFLTSHPIPNGWDKVAHFTVFATITALLWRGTNGRAPIAVLLAVVFFGAFDEVHQIFLPLRSAEFLDFVTDAAAATAVCAVLFMRKKTLCVESSEP